MATDDAASAAIRDQLASLARNALSHYNIDDACPRLIRHNENATFDVRDRTTGRHYLLRVHSPASANLGGIQHTFEGLCAEMEILQAFRRGVGLPLQQPVLNDQGLFVTSAVGNTAQDTVPCTLLTWIEGEGLAEDDPRLPDLVEEFGRVAARMHRFARTWQLRAPLPRPVYDLPKYRYLAARSGVGVTQRLFTQAQYDVVLETMRAIAALWAATPRTDETWGIIHADLGLGNWILAETADGPQPVPIDWCFSGYGPYLFDVGGMAIGYKPHLRPRYLAGYQREAGELNAAELRFCDSCSLLSIFGAVGFHISNPASHEWIARRMPWWTGEYCRLFLAGESPMRADE